MKGKQGKFTGEYTVTGHAPVSAETLALVKRTNARKTTERTKR